VLTRQLLVFSRKERVSPVVLDLNAVVKNLDKMLRQLIDGAAVLTMVLGEDLGRVKADVGHLGQLLLNLVVNARDAMPDGGTIFVSTSNAMADDDRARSPAAATLARYVLLTVSDTGTGMTDEVKARLFQPFFTTKPEGKGTGLGLATCETIVKLCGGRIRVESEVGRGTTVKVYFPAVEEPPDVLTQPPAIGAPDRAPLRESCLSGRARENVSSPDCLDIAL
jgi:signal transduction histidine kinase